MVVTSEAIWLEDSDEQLYSIALTAGPSMPRVALLELSRLLIAVAWPRALGGAELAGLDEAGVELEPLVGGFPPPVPLCRTANATTAATAITAAPLSSPHSSGRPDLRGCCGGYCGQPGLFVPVGPPGSPAWP